MKDKDPICIDCDGTGRIIYDGYDCGTCIVCMGTGKERDCCINTDEK